MEVIDTKKALTRILRELNSNIKVFGDSGKENTPELGVRLHSKNQELLDLLDLKKEEFGKEITPEDILELRGQFSIWGSKNKLKPETWGFDKTVEMFDYLNNKIFSDLEYSDEDNYVDPEYISYSFRGKGLERFQKVLPAFINSGADLPTKTINSLILEETDLYLKKVGTNESRGLNLNKVWATQLGVDFVNMKIKPIRGTFSKALGRIRAGERSWFIKYLERGFGSLKLNFNTEFNKSNGLLGGNISIRHPSTGGVFRTNQPKYVKPIAFRLTRENNNEFIRAKKINDFNSEFILEQPRLHLSLKQAVVDILNLKDLGQTESIVFDTITSIYKNSPGAFRNLLSNLVLSNITTSGNKTSKNT